MFLMQHLQRSIANSLQLSLLAILCFLFITTQVIAIESQTALSREVLLEMAIKSGQVEEVRSLIADGADVNQLFNNGVSPLHSAVINNQEEIAEVLLQAGANVDTTDLTTSATPLHLAALYGRDGIANLLIRNGANVNANMRFNITPLLVAAQFKQAKIIELLLSNKANIEQADQEGFSALHFAAQNGDDVAVKMLLDHGANINARDKTRNATPLMIATEQKQSTVVQILEEFEAQKGAKAGDSG